MNRAMLHRMGRAAAGVVAIAAGLVGGAAASMAAPPPVEIDAAELGFGSFTPGERFTPLRLWVSSPDKSFGGVMIVEFAQDGTQSARVVTPFGTTPGRRTPVEIPVALPSSFSQFVVTMTDGSQVVRRTYSTAPQTPDQRQLNTTITRGGAMVLVVEGSSASAIKPGTEADTKAAEVEQAARWPPPPAVPAVPADPDLPETPTDQKQAADAAKAPDAAKEAVAAEEARAAKDAGRVPGSAAWARANVMQIGLDKLPLVWGSLESADVVVGRAEELSTAEPRVLAALGLWLRSGGRLVLEMDVGGAWRTVLGGDGLGDAGLDGAGEPVTAGSVTTLTSHESLARVAYNRPLTKWKASEQAPEPLRFQGRPMRIGAAARGRGWSELWRVTTPDGQDACVAASGPWGLGQLTLVSAKPERMGPTVSPVMTEVLWRDMVARALPAHLKSSTNADYWGWSSGPDASAVAGLNMALNAVSVVPPLGTEVFIAIASCMGLLIVAIGPLDALLVRRRVELGRRTWATALGWITLASVGAYAMPQLLRSGDTFVTRFSAVEGVCGPDGRVAATAATSVLGIFSGRSERMRLEGMKDGGLWRGVSSVESYRPQSRAATFETTMGTGEDGTRELKPEAIALGQWTFRTSMEQLPWAAGWEHDLRVRVVAGDNAESVKVMIQGLPQGATVVYGEVGLRNGYHPVEWPTGAAADGDEFVGGAPLEQWTRLGIHDNSVFEGQTISLNDEVSASWLPTSRQRIEMLEKMRETGSWAIVSATVKDLPLGFNATGRDVTTGRTAVLRLAVPIDPEVIRDEPRLPPAREDDTATPQ